MMNIILASQSPRRKELLTQSGIKFTSISPNIDESKELLTTQQTAAQLTMNLSAKKSAVIAKNHPESIIIAADTVVVDPLHGIMGKPKNLKEARSMLQRLSGRSHEVYTGVTIQHQKHIDTFYDHSTVFFHPLSPSLIDTYIENGQPLDKAGAYGIQDQGCLFVKKIEGDYYTIVGLPISIVYQKLQKLL